MRFSSFLASARRLAGSALTLLSLLVVGSALAPSSLHAQRQMENLGRGVYAQRTATAEAYLSWRLLGTDPADVSFNVYRSINGAPAVKVNVAPITTTTDYRDTALTAADFTSPISYYVRPLLGGIEQAPSAAHTIAANATVGRQFFTLPLSTPTPNPASTYPYDVKFGWVGDLDGDGEYDFVVDRLSTNPTTERQYLEAYKRDGTFLWRMDMGPNSVNQYAYEPGSTAISIGDTDNVTVYDLDGDGFAEVLVRTANGVTVTNAASVQVAAVTDANDSNQYVSVFDGLTGVEKARLALPNPWAVHGTLTNKCAIGYFDGTRPSVLFYGYNRADSGAFYRVFSAFDYRGGVLSLRWTLAQDQSVLHGAEGHQIRIADVDNDGRDEVIDIGHVIDDDGTQLFHTELSHGDRFHTSDLNPDWPGLETYAIQQYNPTQLATAYYSADTGAMFKKWYAPGQVDVGRGIALDLTSAHRGYEMYSTQPGIWNANGDRIYANNIWAPEGLWWDGDLAREFIDGAGSGALNPVINKFNPATGNADRFWTLYNDAGAFSTHQAYGGRPAFWGDLLGDWREELVLVQSDFAALRVYTTNISATNRLYSLMQNPAYRMQATTKGYVQGSNVDYYLGYGMVAPPPPPISTAQRFWQGGAGALNTWDNGTTAAWRTGVAGTSVGTYANGETVLFDHTGNAAAPVVLNGTLTPGAVNVYANSNYTFDGTAGSLNRSDLVLTKQGAGTLTLTGTHTIGTTTIWDGALRVNGTLNGTQVQVKGGTFGGPLAAGETGGRLSGTGTVTAGVVLEYHGALTPGAGAGAVGTLHLTTLETQDDTALVFDLTDDPTGMSKTNDRLVVTGNIDFLGATTIHINRLDGSLTPGTYTLVDSGGTITGAANLKVTGLEGSPYTLSVTGGFVTLTVPTLRTPGSIVWAGGAGAKWDIANTSAWTLGGSPAVFVPGDAVTFDASGAATPTVTIDEPVSPSAITVNSAADYTFTGSSSILGSAGLTKSGTGTLTITGNHGFTGPVAITGGAVAVAELNDGGVASSLGAAPAAAGGFNIDGGTLRLTGTESTNTNRVVTLGSSGATFDITTSGVTAQFGGGLTGPGKLTKVGAGQLIMATASTYSGGTDINGGSISLSSAYVNATGLGSGLVTLTNGTLSMSNNISTFGTVAAWSLHVPTGATGRLEADGRCDLTGALTGGGEFTIYTPYVRTELKGDWSAFTGKVIAVTDADGGDLRMWNAAGLPNAEFNINGSIWVYWQATLDSDLTVPIGALTGVAGANLRGTVTAGRTLTWSIGGLNTNTSFPGTIANSTGATALTKVGTGTLTLTGANTYSGATTVAAGTLYVNGTSSASPHIVQSGGLLAGTGSITGSLNVQSGGNLLASLAGPLTVNGAVSLNGTVNVTAFTTLADGSYNILTATSFTGSPSFNYTGPLSAGQVATIGGVGRTLRLTLSNISGRSPAPITWTGASSSDWNTTAQNFRLNADSSATNFVAGDAVTFNDTLTANPTIALAAALEPASVAFANNTATYTITSTNGGIAGTATVTKTGTKAAILDGANTYTGATTVSGGHLVINGASASTAFTVQSGGALGGAGVLNADVTVQTGGALAAVAAGPLTVNGTITLPSAAAVSAHTKILDGVYTVVNATALTGASTWTYTGPLYIGQSAVVNATATSVTLTLSGTVSTRDPAAVKWGGAVSGAWNNTAVANWKLSSDGTATPFLAGDTVVFDDTLTANPTITAAIGVAPASVTFSNVTTAYALTSTAPGINGAIALTKNGAGTATLTGTNTYSGGTYVNAGTLALGDKASNNTALGAGAITFGGGNLRFFYTNTVNSTPVIANNFIVPAGQTGRVQFDQRCSMTGTLTGSGTFTAWIPYVRTDMNGNWSAFTGQINVVADLAANGDAYLGDGGDWRINNTAGFPNARVDIANGIYATYLTPGPSGVVLPIGTLSGVAGARLAGTGTAGRTATWTIGARNEDSTYAGTIINGTGPSALNKVGTGTLTLAGSNTYTGTTVVTAGKLVLSGANTNSGATTVNAGTLEITGSLTNTSTVEVKSGATLKVTGTLSVTTLTIRSGGKLIGGGVINATVVNEGLIEAGAGATFTITGNLTNSATGTIRLKQGGALVHSGGTFTNNGVYDVLTAGAHPTPGAGSGSTIEASAVQVTSFTLTGGGAAEVTVKTHVGHSYQLQRKTELDAAAWENVGSSIDGTGAMLTLSDATPPVGPRGFYRVIIDQ